MINQCYGIWGKIFGHKYIPRYSTKRTTDKIPIYKFDATGSVLSTHFDSIRGIIETYAETTKTYTHSICIKCGDIIERN